MDLKEWTRISARVAAAAARRDKARDTLATAEQELEQAQAELNAAITGKRAAAPRQAREHAANGMVG